MTSLAAMTLDKSGGHRIGTGKSSALEEPSPDQSDSTDYGGLWLWEEGLGDDGALRPTCTRVQSTQLYRTGCVSTKTKQMRIPQEYTLMRVLYGFLVLRSRRF